MHVAFGATAALLAVTSAPGLALGTAAVVTPHQHVLLAPDGRAADLFGKAVAISGRVAVVGAPNRTVHGHKAQGAAYVFVRPRSQSWSHAQLKTILTVAHGHAGDQFGLSVTVAGRSIAVGAPFVTNGSDTHEGAVYVFNEPASGWSGVRHPNGRLVPSDQAADDGFGTALASRRRTFVVGSPGHVVGQHYQQGAAYIFIRPSSGWQSRNTETKELTATNGLPFSRLGISVAISGHTVVAGSPFDSVNKHPSQGSAAIFVESPQGWRHTTETARLTARGGAQGDSFGYAVAIAGGTVAVGAPGKTVGGNKNQGTMYVFSRPSSGWRNSQQSATLTVVPGVKSAYFGAGVAATSRFVIGSGFGVDSVFPRPSGGWHGHLHQHSQLTGANAFDRLGDAIAISGHKIIAGAPSQAVNRHAYQGAAYVFIR
jgi:hypothetical protein